MEARMRTIGRMRAERVAGVLLARSFRLVRLVLLANEH
jgi:hypothetical protein